MTVSITNPNILVSPDTHAPLQAAKDGTALLTSDGSEEFRISDGIICLLPKSVDNEAVKAKELEGWRTVFEKNHWEVSADGILSLPESSDDPYWQKVDLCFELVKGILGENLSGKHGLDLACGIGWATAKFAQSGAKMIGADFNDTVYNGLGAAIKMREKGLEFDAVCCDSESLPIADGSLDFAFICSALHHFTQPEKCLREIYRTLKPGGMLIDICEAFRTGIHDEEREQEHKTLVEFREAGINEQSFTQKEYEAMFAGAGFTLTTLFPEWDKPIGGTDINRWMYTRLRENADTHPRLAMRLILKTIGFGPVLSLLRWRKAHRTVSDRVFIARKP